MLRLKTSFQLFGIGALSVMAALQVTPAQPHAWASQDDLPVVRPDRFAAVTKLLDEQPGRMSGLVLSSRGRVLFSHAADDRYELASVAKVHILTSYLDRLAQEQRGPTGQEFEELRSMITQSENAPATQFFHAVGGAEGINQFLQSKGMAPLDPAWDGSWGSMQASPAQVAEFLSRLYRHRLLDNPSTLLALSLLSGVADEQAWGVGSATQTGPSVAVYFKNGWLPSDSGWIVHSTGILSEREDQAIYVFMTDQQPTFEQPVETIEAAVRLLRQIISPVVHTPPPHVIPSATPAIPANRP